MNRASMDIGSNSLLLTVVDDAGTVLHDEARVVGLGRGLQDGGRFAPDRARYAAQVLGDYVAIAGRFGVPAQAIAAVATSGARRAEDAPAFFARVHEELGLAVRTISGDEEAVLSFRGALRGLTLAPGPRMVIDLGGGSTEVVLGEHAPDWRVSLEIGSVRMTERFLGEGRYAPADVARLRSFVDAAIAPAAPAFAGSPRVAVSVAGTATTLAAMDLGLSRYDGARVHGHLLRVDALEALAEALAASDPAARRRLAAVSPERADFLFAGAQIILALLRAASLDATVISDGGLRFGLLAAPT